MTMVSADKQQTSGSRNNERASYLQIVLLDRTFVLPWHQFLYAEGGNDEIRLVFSTHDVVVKGTQLESLLSDLCAQRVSRLREPGRSDSFRPGYDPHITSISVRKLE